MLITPKIFMEGSYRAARIHAVVPRGANRVEKSFSQPESYTIMVWIPNVPQSDLQFTRNQLHEIADTASTLDEPVKWLSDYSH